MSEHPFKLCRDYMTTRCRDHSCKWAHDASYCKLAWSGHCPYGERCRNKHKFPPANRKDRKKAIAMAVAKEEAKCQALMEMEKKGLLPPGTAAAAIQASVRYSRGVEGMTSDASSDVSSRVAAAAVPMRRGRSAGSRRSRSRSTTGLSSAKIAEVAANATATAALFGPNTMEGRRARSAIAVIRSLPLVGRALERIRDASSSRPTSRAPSARSRDSGPFSGRPRSGRTRDRSSHIERTVPRDPAVIHTTAAQEPQLAFAIDCDRERLSIPLGPRVVSVHTAVFSKPGDEAIYDRLSNEIQTVILAQERAKEAAAEAGSNETHQGKTSGGAWRKQCPTFRAVVDRVKAYFNLKDVISTRLNLFSDESESRPFQSEKLKKGEKAQLTNFMISLSFGGPREHGLMDPHTGRIVSLPLSNGVVYGFGKEIMDEWYHGVLDVPVDKRVPGRGRVSLVLWVKLETAARPVAEALPSALSQRKGN